LPRTRAVVFTRAASFSIPLGRFQIARSHLDEASAAAQEAGVWMYQVGVLTVRAELFIAEGQQELAWPLAEEAVRIARTHACVPAELAGLERLRRQWVLATRGLDGLSHSGNDNRQMVRVAERLELEALNDWANMKPGNEVSSRALRELVARKLYGVIAKLIALRVFPGELPTTLNGETSAQLTARLFADPSPLRPVPFPKGVRTSV
jgi:hypothetical protein